MMMIGLLTTVVGLWWTTLLTATGEAKTVDATTGDVRTIERLTGPAWATAKQATTRMHEIAVFILADFGCLFGCF